MKEISTVIPEYQKMTGQILQTAFWLVVMVAVIVILHGIHVMLGNKYQVAQESQAQVID